MGMTECGPCPDAEHYLLVSGIYSQSELIEHAPPNGEFPPLPHLDATDMRMTVDVARKTVVIEYQKEGKAVVETWRW
jgi:hypothetical protein